MEIKIDPRKVAGASAELLRITADKGFTNVEILVAMAEAAGRLTVSSSNGDVMVARQIAEFLSQHIRTTINIGCGITKTGESRIWTPK